MPSWPNSLETRVTGHCHDCMHAAGCSLEEIGDFVGHSSSYMVDRYRHLLEGQRERAAERLDAFLTGASPGATGAQTLMVER